MAHSQCGSSMSSNVRLYVASRVAGNSFKASRIRPGRQRRRKSSWQDTQRNLHADTVSATIVKDRDISGLHPVGVFRKHVDDEILVLGRPPSHLYIRTNNELDVVKDVLLLSFFVMEGNGME